MCSLSTLRSAGYPNATQDSLPAGGLALAGRDSNPLGCSPGFATCWLSHGFLQVEASCRTAEPQRSQRREIGRENQTDPELLCVAASLRLSPSCSRLRLAALTHDLAVRAA